MLLQEKRNMITEKETPNTYVFEHSYSLDNITITSNSIKNFTETENVPEQFNEEKTELETSLRKYLNKEADKKELFGEIKTSLKKGGQKCKPTVGKIITESNNKITIEVDFSFDDKSTLIWEEIVAPGEDVYKKIDQIILMGDIEPSSPPPNPPQFQDPLELPIPNK